MRYGKSESTYILGNFDSGDTVTIDIYKASDNTKVVDGASCSEIGTTGVFKYNFSQTITSKEEYLWIMSNGSLDQRGKIVLGGYMDTLQDDITFLKDIEGGRWKREGTQMIFYKDDNTTEVARFDLYQSTGKPATASDEVWERQRA